MNDDAALLRRYAKERDEAAFAELVQRHLPLVYSAALRQLGGAVHRAEEVTQGVFTDLARNAAPLSRRADIAGWLYTSTHFAAAKLKRTEQRRQAREQEAHLMHEVLSGSPAEADWERLGPVLDDALHELGEGERTVILQRFFQGRRFADLAAQLGLSEDAARMRVERALEKLRGGLARRRITSTTAALSAVLANQAVAAAPTALAGSVLTSALSAVAESGGALGAVKLMVFMNTSKIGVTVAVLAAAAAVSTAVMEVRDQRTAEATTVSVDAAVRTLTLRVGELQRRVEDEARQAADARRALAAAQAALLERPAPVAKSVGVDAEELAGREFLAKHPEAQVLIEGSVQENFELNWGADLRAMNVTAAEREILAREVMKVADWVLRVTASGWSVGPRNSEDAGRMREAQRLRDLLGPERTAQFAEQSGLKPVNTILRSVAAASYDAATPLTVEQTRVVTQTIMGLGGQMRQIVGGTALTPKIADLSKVDWPEVSRRLAGTLAPAQLAALETAAASEAAKLEQQRAGQRFIVPVTPRSGRGG